MNFQKKFHSKIISPPKFISSTIGKIIKIQTGFLFFFQSINNVYFQINLSTCGCLHKQTHTFNLWKSSYVSFHSKYLKRKWKIKFMMFLNIKYQSILNKCIYILQAHLLKREKQWKPFIIITKKLKNWIIFSALMKDTQITRNTLKK